MSWDDESPTEYLGPGGWDVEVPNGKVIRMSKTHAEIAENQHGAKVLGPSSYEPTWDDLHTLTVVPKVSDNPYDDGLAALLYAHGAVQEAEEIHRKLVASGGTVPKGGFPSRCTSTDEHGVRCYREYAHAGEHDFGMGITTEEAILDTLFTPKRGGIKYGEVKFMADQQPPSRVIDDNKAVEFLRNKTRENLRKIREVKDALIRNEQEREELQAEEARLHEEQRHFQEAIATLKGVISGKRGEGGEGHGGSR